MFTRKGLFLALAVVFVLAGLVTLVPQASASRACLLGYRAHCTFVPMSTLICWAAAGVAAWLGLRTKRPPTGG